MGLTETKIAQTYLKMLISFLRLICFHENEIGLKMSLSEAFVLTEPPKAHLWPNRELILN